ncbi:MAG TPA: hypothetical protein VFH80_14830 [Solirubrobacteraceae bacterium]|nr:hypothetical protein [Solirubrobacteraceae bacterium]
MLRLLLLLSEGSLTVFVLVTDRYLDAVSQTGSDVAEQFDLQQMRTVVGDERRQLAQRARPRRGVSRPVSWPPK